MKIPYINATRNVNLGFFNLSLSDLFVNESIVFYGNPEEDGGGHGYINYTPDATGGVITLGALNVFRVPDLANCDTIDTDANGILSCGSDGTGSGADYSKIQNSSTTDCVTGNYSYGRYSNGTWKCSPDLNSGGIDTWSTNITFYWNASQIIAYMLANHTALDLKITNNDSLRALHTNVALNTTYCLTIAQANYTVIDSKAAANYSLLATHSDVTQNATLAANWAMQNATVWDAGNLSLCKSWNDNNQTYTNNMINQNDSQNKGEFWNVSNIGDLTDTKICIWDNANRKINCTYTDSTGSGADWSKIQNWTGQPCATGSHVMNLYQNGTANCTADTGPA